MSNVQSVHLQALNVSNFEVAQLVVIQVQVISWKSHNYNSIYWGFFLALMMDYMWILKASRCSNVLFASWIRLLVMLCSKVSL